MARKITTKKVIPAVQFITRPEPGWVNEMHAHFHKTGYYRPQDLERVLGDPRRGMEVKVADFFPASAASKS